MNQLNLIIEQHYVASSSADRTYSKKGERGGSVGLFCQFIPQSKFSRFFITSITIRLAARAIGEID